jgi:hypothetical protein
VNFVAPQYKMTPKFFQFKDYVWKKIIISAQQNAQNLLTAIPQTMKSAAMVTVAQAVKRNVVAIMIVIHPTVNYAAIIL